MCGIVGWIDWEHDILRERRCVQEMAQTMACRGPDAEGVWLSENAGLGHRRLAVVDVPGGYQPMCAGPAILVFSGEIYNFTDLRKELESFGHTFHTTSDTEVLLHAYLQWGADCARHLNGMYAFAVWDARKQELSLVRDRLGIKPLYYVQLATGLIFASEPKALLRHPRFEARLDAEGLAELFTMPPGRTPGFGIYQDLRELPPGCVLTCTRRGARETRYWRLTSEPHTDTPAATVETVRGLLEDIVSRHMVSDVPLCTLLSGGVDSSALTALAQRSRTVDDPLGTFSVSFSDSVFSPNFLETSQDAPYAALMARHLGTQHSEVRLDADDLIDHLYEPLAARDLPGMGDIDVSLLLLFRKIREMYTVALSGESADEVFHGYRWMRPDQSGGAGTFPWTYPAPEHLDIRSKELRSRVRLDEYHADRYRDALSEVPYLPGEGAAAAGARAAAYVTLTRFLPALLDRKDRLSMAVGLEVRVPYCDHRLLEYAWNIPQRLHWSAGIEKSVLRNAVRDLVPPSILRRTKSHYPSTRSAAFGQAVLERIRDWLSTPASPAREFVDVRRLEQIVNSPTPYQFTRPSYIWLLEFDTWLRTYGVRLC